MPVLQSVSHGPASVAALLIAITPFPAALHAQAATVRDSAGIHIIQNPSRLEAPTAFQLAGRPSFDVGGLEDDPELEINSRQGYFGGVQLSDGHFVIIDQSRLQFFDGAGKRLRVVGRNGSGPGEFRSVTSVCRVKGDTILVTDGSRRVTILGPDGDFIATHPFGKYGYSERQSCFDDGTLLAKLRVSSDPTGSVYSLNRVRPDGSLVRHLADVNMGAFDPAVRRSTKLIASGDRLYVGDALSFDIDVYDATGKLASVIRTNDRLVPVDKDELAKMQPLATRAGASRAEIEATQKRIVSASHTRNWPTYDRFYVDDDGRLWVEDWAQRMDITKPDHWTAFDRSGRLLGRLTIPPSTREKPAYVIGFGHNEVYLRRTDDDGAIHFSVFPLVPVRQ